MNELALIYWRRPRGTVDTQRSHVLCHTVTHTHTHTHRHIYNALSLSLSLSACLHARAREKKRGWGGGGGGCARARLTHCAFYGVRLSKLNPCSVNMHIFAWTFSMGIINHNSLTLRLTNRIWSLWSSLPLSIYNSAIWEEEENDSIVI